MTKFVFILMVLLLSIAGCKASEGIIENFCYANNKDVVVTADGRLLTLNDFYSSVLDVHRHIRIYLPVSYENNSNTKYPVLYMHDGDRLFGPTDSWNIDAVYDKLVAENKINEVILIGIDNNKDRNNEYLPYYDPYRGRGGKGDLYLSFIINELMPYINKNYRVKLGPENTGILGSSYGSTISVYSAWKRPDIFGMSGGMSIVLSQDASRFIKEVMNDTSAKRNVKFYIDCGDGAYEGGDIANSSFDVGDYLHHSANNGVIWGVEVAVGFTRLLQAKGWKYSEDLLLDIGYGDPHKKYAWHKRFHKPLIFFFGKSNNFNPTNISAFVSRDTISTGDYNDNVMLMTKVFYNTGVSANLPIDMLTITSSQPEMFEIKKGLIYLRSGNINGDTDIELNIEYMGLTTSCVLHVVD